MSRVRHGDQVVLQLEGRIPPKGEGPPLHVHLVEREEVKVVAGVLSAIVGGAAIQVRVGESGVFPVGVAHRWWECRRPSRSKQRATSFPSSISTDFCKAYSPSPTRAKPAERRCSMLHT